jgi:hypothetical protein
MATVAAPSGPAVGPRAESAGTRRRQRLPWLMAGGALFVLLAVSAYMRTRAIGGQFWMDEGLSVGIASHPLAQIPGVLRHDGSPPLFYLLLHGWMTLFGAGESATHAMSLLFALLTIPVGMWAGWSLVGRRAGYIAAILFAFSSFLTQYAQETRMYALVGLLGLVATAAFVHAFVFRRRGYLAPFAIALALMAYTHAWGIFFGAGAILALIPVWRASEDRRGIVRDALLSFVAAAALFAPWLPNFLYQAAHTAAPWDRPPRFGVPALISRQLLGGDLVTIMLLVSALVGLRTVAWGRRRERHAATLVGVLLVLPVGTLALAWIASQVNPAWNARYFAPLLAPILLLAAYGASRARVVGVVAVAACIIFLARPGAFAPAYKSDMRDVGGEMSALVHRGDVVLVSEPEEVPLAWYYLPAGLRYANSIGPVTDPRYMDWVNALRRLQNARWRSIERSLIASLKPGQQVLFVRPLTEGVSNWETPWGRLVRRRSAQWGALLQSDPSLKPVAWAPHSYPTKACCVANSAVLYKKVA